VSEEWCQGQFDDACCRPEIVPDTFFFIYLSYLSHFQTPVSGPDPVLRQFLGGFTVIDVADEQAARQWAGKLAEACGWPQEVRRVK
jgi:hypothetical protein